MKIAFYAPLKSPNHPVPSGDRLMARLLMQALADAGHFVEIVSEFRGYAGEPDPKLLGELAAEAKAEAGRIAARWQANGAPDLWFTYHSYYKSPDRLGPALSASAGIPYVTAEASYSKRRDEGDWFESQQLVVAGVRQAALNLCLTERDRAGLLAAVPEGRYARLPPFVDTARFAASVPGSRRLVTVAMMRSGVKFDSYVMLAKALERIRERDWTLTVIGGGPKRDDVRGLFSAFGEDRIVWRGELAAETVAAELAAGGVYVWPGFGEAYGLAYLEAQAAGLPVVAQKTAGVPEVVVYGTTGLLTGEGDIGAFAQAIASLLDDDARRGQMADAALRFAHGERSLAAASKRLDLLLRQYASRSDDR